MSAAAEVQEETSGAEKSYFSVENINAYYGDSYIVQDVSFDVRLQLCGRLPGLMNLKFAVAKFGCKVKLCTYVPHMRQRFQVFNWSPKTAGLFRV